MNVHNSEPLSPDEAKLLNFKAPAPQKLPSPGIATTTVVGYFNQNQWPLHLAISQIGISYDLANRGDYVVDGNGRKVNDPILDAYVGPGMLAREITSVPVPVIRFIPVQASVGGAHAVTGTATMSKDLEGRVIKPMFTPVSTSVPLPNAMPVAGMSMETARKLGLVRRTIDPGESPVTDTTGTPVEGNQIPTIDEFTPRDMNPGELRRYQQDSAPAPRLAQPETPAQGVLQARLESAASLPETEDAVSAAIAAAAGKPADPLTHLPKPNLCGDTDGAKGKFVCCFDGKEFDYRSQLKNYAKRKFPDSVDEIMAPYAE